MKEKRFQTGLIRPTPHIALPDGCASPYPDWLGDQLSWLVDRCFRRQRTENHVIVLVLISCMSSSIITMMCSHRGRWLWYKWFWVDQGKSSTIRYVCFIFLVNMMFCLLCFIKQMSHLYPNCLQQLRQYSTKMDQRVLGEPGVHQWYQGKLKSGCFSVPCAGKVTAYMNRSRWI